MQTKIHRDICVLQNPQSGETCRNQNRGSSSSSLCAKQAASLNFRDSRTLSPEGFDWDVGLEHNSRSPSYQECARSPCDSTGALDHLWLGSWAGDTNPFFSESTADDFPFPDTDILQQAVEMHFPEVRGHSRKRRTPAATATCPQNAGLANAREIPTSREEEPPEDVFESRSSQSVQSRYSDDDGEHDIVRDRSNGTSGFVQASDDAGCEADHERLARANRCRLRSRGMTAEQRVQSRRAPFHKMNYVVSEMIKGLKKPPSIHMAYPDLFMSYPTQGFARPAPGGRWDREWSASNADAIADMILATGMRSAELWQRGLERASGKGGPVRFLTWPEGFAYRIRVPCKTLSAQYAERNYSTVNLSAPPSRGFSHIELVVDSLPVLSRQHVPHLITLQVRNTRYLGVLCTAQDAPGLLVHRLHSNYVTLIRILDMHTRLQVHAFVPRTFALHCVMDDEKPEKAVGVFVGERPGSDNLGDMLLTTAYDDTVTFAYHLLRCLLRVQIAAVHVLGFPMKILQPARLWKREGIFVADMLGCLVDTLYVWKLGDAGPFKPIWITLGQLGLQRYVPAEIATRLQAETQIPECATVAEQELRTLYSLCDYLDSSVATNANCEWWKLLGSDSRYRDITLPISSNRQVQPYGPFFLKIQNQIIKWNRAIMVEPVLGGPAFFGQLDPREDLLDDARTRALVDTFAPNSSYLPPATEAHALSDVADEPQRPAEPEAPGLLAPVPDWNNLDLSSYYEF